MRLKTAQLGLLLAFALILSYVESILPFSPGIPGVKLGLPNLAVVLCLCLYGKKEAFLIDVLRVLAAGFLFGNLYTIVYSMGGALLSFLMMVLMRRSGGFGLMGVSMGGGIAHNVGQLLVAYAVVRTAGVFFYFPVLLLSGMITGGLIGFIAMKVEPHIRAAGQAGADAGEKGRGRKSL